MTASVIEHKFGEDAKEAYKDTIDVGLNVISMERAPEKIVKKGVVKSVKSNISKNDK